MVTKLERENNTIFYLHNAWANSPDGTAGFTLEETDDAAYIGNCISMSSAEVLNPSSYNWIAVEFEAVEESDTAELTELGEDVPEDPEDEDDDYSYEDYMDGAVQAAADTATTAQESADIAQQKAEEATASAALAQQKAEEATASAAEAKTAADTAREKAEAATTDAATAKQKAEEATSSAALAQQKAESATAAAETAHSAAQSATSDARTAGIAAATAQAAAEAAQGDIDDQKKYFYHDKLGAHVLDAAGGAYRTDIKSDGVHIVQTTTETPIASYGATSTIGATAGKNMRVSGDGVEIRDGEKVLASYGASEIVLGDLSGDNILLEANRMAIRAGAAEKMAIESTKTTNSVTEKRFFDGARVDDELAPGGISMNRWTLNNPVEIKKVSIKTDSGKEVGSGTYSWSIYGSATLQIVISGDSQEAMAVDWTEYTTLEVTYESGSIVSNTKCDKFEAKDNAGKFVSFTEISSGTGTATATTGRVTTQPNWWRCGNLVQLEFGVAATNAVNPGKNIATGTITGIPRPVTTIGLRSVSYYGNNANVTLVSKDGAFTVRNCGSDALAKGNDASGIFTYITDGTFTGGGA